MILPALKYIFAFSLILFTIGASIAIGSGFFKSKRPADMPKDISTRLLADRPTDAPLKKQTATYPVAYTKNPVNRGLRLGIAVNDYANRSGELLSVEKDLGKKISTVSIFKQFGSKTNNSLSMDDLAYAKSQNMKIQLAWEPWNPEEGQNQSVDYLNAIVNGKEDAYLQSFADSLRNYNGPVVLRFGHEMNGNWYPWGNRPEDYIKAYRYIFNFFKKSGVGNVTWMWCTNAENVPTSPISQVSKFYPGDDVVDEIGIDGFNFGKGSWRSFNDIFLPAYNFLQREYPKPIVIAETASSENGGNKALWIEDMFDNSLPNFFPKVKEVVWFNILKETDWRLNSSPASLAAFRDSAP